MNTRRPISTTPALILHAVGRGFRHGFDIMDATGLPSGTVYPALRRLEAAGRVRSKWEAQAAAERAKRPRRRYYELTSTGVRALDEAHARYPWLAAVGRSLPSGAEPA